MKDKANNPIQGKPMHQPQGIGIPRPRRKRRWWAPLLLVAVLVVSGLVAATVSKDVRSSGPAGGTFTARRSDLIITVSEGGSIRAHKSVEYRCQVERRGAEVTIVSIVPPGTVVTQKDVDDGLVLVKLDSSQLEEQLIAERMELAGDRQNATSEKEAYDIQVIQNESDIAAGELRVRFALMDLQKYLGAEMAAKLTEDVNDAVNLSAHVAPFLTEVKQDPNVLAGSAASQELKRFQDDIVLAVGNLRTAEATLIGTEKLHDANYVSDLDLQRDRLTVTNRKFSEENARVSLDLFWRYDFPKNAEQYLSDYIETKRELERTYAQCRSRLAQATARRANADERYRAQEVRVAELERQIEYCTIRAKAPGLVIYGTGGSGDAFRAMRGRSGGGGGIIAEGETVFEGQTILSMPDTTSWVAEISVHETEVDKVRPGQPATIVMDAFPDQILQGRVLEVAPLPDQQRGWMNPDLKVYQTLISIEGVNDFLKTRMSCKTEILVRRLNDVVVVPIQVVANRRGRKVCYVLSPQGSAEEREVQTGAFNDTFVQIVSGLEEGEQVLLNPPLFTDSGASDFEERAIPEGPELSPADANAAAAQPQLDGQPGGAGRRSGGRRGGMPDLSNMTDEQRQQMMERFRQMRGGQGMPDPGNMTDEQRQQMMERFRQMRGGDFGGTGQGQADDGTGRPRRSRGQRGGGQNPPGDAQPADGPTQ
jgi:HlyD family secretion protein